MAWSVTLVQATLIARESREKTSGVILCWILSQASAELSLPSGNEDLAASSGVFYAFSIVAFVPVALIGLTLGQALVGTLKTFWLTRFLGAWFVICAVQHFCVCSLLRAYIIDWRVFTLLRSVLDVAAVSVSGLVVLRNLEDLDEGDFRSLGGPPAGRRVQVYDLRAKAPVRHGVQLLEPTYDPGRYDYVDDE